MKIEILKKGQGFCEMEASTSLNLSLREGIHIRKSRLYLISLCIQHHMAAGLVRLLLLLAGIEPNPGPKTWRCSVCSQVLAKNATSVQCNGCNHWCHLRRCSDLQSHLDWTTKYKAPCCAATSNALPGCFPAQIPSKCVNRRDNDNSKFAREENVHIDHENLPFSTTASDDDPVAINIEKGVKVMENHGTRFFGNHKLQIAKVVLRRVDSIHYAAGREHTNLCVSKLSGDFKVEDGTQPMDMVSKTREDSTLNFIKEEPLDIIDEYSIKEEPPIEWKVSYAPLKKEDAFQDPHCYAPLATPSSTEELTNHPAVTATEHFSAALPIDGRESSAGKLRNESSYLSKNESLIDPSSIIVGSRSLPHICNQYDNGIKKERNLDQHVSTQSVEQLLANTQCAEAFASKEHVLRHRTLRVLEAPFVCDMCRGTFESMRLLKKHILKAHLGVGVHARKSTVKSNGFHRQSQRTRHIEQHNLSYRGKKPYECSECGKTFIKKHILMAHLRSLTAEIPYECTECRKKYRRKWDLIEHRRVHSGVKPFKCPQCAKAFAQKRHIKQHLNSHSEEKPYSDCGKAFAQNSGFYRYLHSQNNKDKTYECSICGKPSSEQRYLSTHLRVHRGEKPYECPKCGKAFVEKRTIKKHVLTHTGEKPYECSRCERSFAQKSVMMRHLRSHSGEKLNQCNECGKSFSRPGNLTDHIRLHTGEKPFTCHQCGKVFSQKGHLIYHVRTHYDDKQFECSECGKKFYTNSDLNSHLRLHKGEKPYKCSLCEKAFPCKSYLTQHARHHTGEKPYVCSECRRAFAHRTGLRRHLMLHTGERPYECTECGKAFTNSSKLKQHFRQHTGEKPYKCSQCGKTFTNSSNLRKHSHKHTDEKTL